MIPAFAQRASAVVLLHLSLFAIGALADHPSLDKSTDPENCIQCHATALQGSHRHSALAVGCNACHVVRSDGGRTQFVLTQPKDQICLMCHTAEVPERGSSHAPWRQGECLSCHDAHASNYPRHLLTSPDRLCASCHAPTSLHKNKPRLERQRRASSLCLTCHWPHSSASPNLLRR